MRTVRMTTARHEPPQSAWPQAAAAGGAFDGPALVRSFGGSESSRQEGRLSPALRAAAERAS